MTIEKITQSDIRPLDQVDKINEIIDNKQDVMLAGDNITFDYTWTVSSSKMPVDNLLNWQLATDGTKILATNQSGTIYESTDNGETWQIITTLEVIESYYSTWCSIAYDGTTFVVLHSEGLVAIQNNDETWTVIEVPALSLSYSDTWESMTYDGTRLVCLSRYGKIGYSSSHGQTWNISNYSLVEYTDTTHYWCDIAFNGNKYVALSNQGFISTTENILSSAWSTSVQKFNNEEDWKIIEYDGSKLLTVSIMGSTSTSVDGEVWTDMAQHDNLKENPYPYWEDITFIDGKCIIISDYGYLAYGVPAISTTGLMKKSDLDLLYPVGSIYIGTQATCPLATLISGSTWTLVAADRVLQGSSTNHAANTTIAAGLPNISGGALTLGRLSSSSASTTSGAITRVATDKQGTGYYGSTNSYNSNVSINARNSNTIYGNSSTVQPPAYVVNVWRRTA